jgi:hypothetical protein
MVVAGTDIALGLRESVRIIAHAGQTPAVRARGLVRVHSRRALSGGINRVAVTLEASPEPGFGEGNETQRRTKKEWT